MMGRHHSEDGDLHTLPWSNFSIVVSKCERSRVPRVPYKWEILEVARQSRQIKQQCLACIWLKPQNFQWRWGQLARGTIPCTKANVVSAFRKKSITPILRLKRARGGQGGGKTERDKGEFSFLTAKVLLSPKTAGCFASIGVSFSFCCFWHV